MEGWLSNKSSQNKALLPLLTIQKRPFLISEAPFLRVLAPMNTIQEMSATTPPHQILIIQKLCPMLFCHLQYSLVVMV